MSPPTRERSDVVCELRGVSKSFGDLTVLRDVDFSVVRGEHVAILGRSGTGKSVLLKLLVGLLAPDEGEVRLLGTRVDGRSDRDLASVRRRLGFVYQMGALFDSMTVGQNVAFPLLERGDTPDDAMKDRVHDLLERVGLRPEVADKAPSELSGGMRKRVAIARALAPEPEILLYDEPTTGLDPETGRMISCLMRDLGGTMEATSIAVTHDIDCARTVAERWAFLSDGVFRADGPPESLFSSRDEDVQRFLAPWASMLDLSKVTGEP